MSSPLYVGQALKASPEPVKTHPLDDPAMPAQVLAALNSTPGGPGLHARKPTAARGVAPIGPELIQSVMGLPAKLDNAGKASAKGSDLAESWRCGPLMAIARIFPRLSGDDVALGAEFTMAGGIGAELKLAGCQSSDRIEVSPSAEPDGDALTLLAATGLALPSARSQVVLLPQSPTIGEEPFRECRLGRQTQCH